MSIRQLICILVLAGVPALLSAQAPDLTATVRPLLESTLRERAGIGFAEFSCDADLPLRPDERFTCTAVDEEGDQLVYTLAVDDEGIADVVRASQPASSLPPELLAALTTPCGEFLTRFDNRSWDKLIEGLHPALQAEIDDHRIASRLDEIRSVLGEMQPVEAALYTASESGRHQLEYSLAAGIDGAVARFEITADDAGDQRMISFVVTADAGTPASVAMITLQGREILGRLIGSPVERIEAPLDQLSTPGDMIEGVAVLEGGRTTPIAVQQTGHLDDFDPADYFFSLLDTETLVASGIRGRLDGVTEIECDAPVVPDGGEVRCVVNRVDAPAMEFVLSRRGADHRLRSAGAPSP